MSNILIKNVANLCFRIGFKLIRDSLLKSKLSILSMAISLINLYYDKNYRTQVVSRSNR